MATQSDVIDPNTVEREVRYIQSAWSKLVTPVPDALAAELIADIITWAGRTHPLASDESAIVTLLKPKTAALFADRVWMQWAGEEPRLDFAFGWESPVSVRLAALHAFQYRTADEAERESWKKVTSLSPEAARLVVSAERQLTSDYHARTGAPIAPLYASVKSRDTQYRPGEWPVIVAVAENLGIVAEEALDWRQVLEFRRDHSARTAYRRFVHWLDAEMIDKSAQFIVDEVSARLERYDWAVRKHGLQTVIGAVESTLNTNSLVGASAAALTVQSLSQQPWFSLLAAGGLLVGRTAVTAAVKLIERAEIRNAHRDIAFVYEARSHFET